MVKALHSGSSGLGSSVGRSHCVVFLGKILNSHSASLHTGDQRLNCQDNLTKTLGVYRRWLASHPGEY